MPPLPADPNLTNRQIGFRSPDARCGRKKTETTPFENVQFLPGKAATETRGDLENGSDIIEFELQRILTSSSLARAPRLRRVLAYAVHFSAQGRTKAMKEYTIGIEVFDRSADFDPRIDSIVRVEASRLRKHLARYYQADGSNSPVRFTIPPGGYAPVIQFSGGHEQPTEISRSFIPAVAVLPFGFTSKRRGNRVNEAVTARIVHNLTQKAGIRVIPPASSLKQPRRSSSHEIANISGAEFIVEGTVIPNTDNFSIIAYLIGASEGYNLWSGAYTTATNSVEGPSIQIASDIFLAIGNSRKAVTRALPKPIAL